MFSFIALLYVYLFNVIDSINWFMKWVCVLITFIKENLCRYSYTTERNLITVAVNVKNTKNKTNKVEVLFSSLRTLLICIVFLNFFTLILY